MQAKEKRGAINAKMITVVQDGSNRGGDILELTGYTTFVAKMV